MARRDSRNRRSQEPFWIVAVILLPSNYFKSRQNCVRNNLIAPKDRQRGRFIFEKCWWLDQLYGAELQNTWTCIARIHKQWNYAVFCVCIKIKDDYPLQDHLSYARYAVSLQLQNDRRDGCVCALLLNVAVVWCTAPINFILFIIDMIWRNSNTNNSVKCA